MENREFEAGLGELGWWLSRRQVQGLPHRRGGESGGFPRVAGPRRRACDGERRDDRGNCKTRAYQAESDVPMHE